MLGRVFKAYDVRGAYPELLNDTIAWQIGYGTAKFLLTEAKAVGETTPMMQNIVVGRDARASSPTLTKHLIKGMTDFGAGVIDIGLVDTPMVWFAINHLDCAGGVMVTASHNPPGDNGFKIARRKAAPVGQTSGLVDIRKLAAMVDRATVQSAKGRTESRDLWEAYAQHVQSFLHLSGVSASRPLKIVIDASNGVAGEAVPKVLRSISGLKIVELNFEHGKGIMAHDPNPLVAANLEQLRGAVLKHKAKLGVCFDGDADRVVAVDEKGGIIGGDMLTALIARHRLPSSPGAAVVCDLRSSRAVDEEIVRAGGRVIRGRVGHVFMKEQMAQQRALFGGELSGHYYFRENFGADSGLIALCVLLSIVSQQKKPLSKLISPIARYEQSGEVNFQVQDKDLVLNQIREKFASSSSARLSELDGITVDAFSSQGWWANIRQSNTEPLLRLNAEGKDAKSLRKALDLLTPILGQAQAPHPHEPGRSRPAAV